MFCSGCGVKLQEGVACCSSCGTETSRGAAAPPQSQTIMARNFRCNGCGTPLKIPNNSRAPVRCPSCKTNCIIEGIIRNAEIATKENINSGVHLFATPAKIYHELLSILIKAPYVVLQKIEVVREERYCVPAYCFYCNGTASFTYEKGVERTEAYTEFDVNAKTRGVSRRITHTDWYPGSSSASVSPIVFAPGNREMASQIMKLYSSFDPKNLFDIERMQFPADVVTYKYDLPQPAAFTEYVLPDIDKILEEKAKSSVSTQKIRNVSMGGSKVQKDVVRVFFGLYRVVYTYDGEEYSVWISGDGKRSFHEVLPEDQGRKNAIANLDNLDKKEKDMGELEKDEVPLPPAKDDYFISAIVGFLSLLWLVWILVDIRTGFVVFPFFLLFVYLLIDNNKKVNKERKAREEHKEREEHKKQEHEEIKRRIRAIEHDFLIAEQQFIEKKRILHGIYENVNVEW